VFANSTRNYHRF